MLECRQRASLSCLLRSDVSKKIQSISSSPSIYFNPCTVGAWTPLDQRSIYFRGRTLMSLRRRRNPLPFHHRHTHLQHLPLIRTCCTAMTRSFGAELSATIEDRVRRPSGRPIITRLQSHLIIYPVPRLPFNRPQQERFMRTVFVRGRI